MAVNKQLIIIFIFFFLIIGGIVASYFIYYKPLAQEEARNLTQYFNLNIKSLDEQSQKQIVSDYNIYLDNGFFYGNGTTTSADYVFQQIQSNSSFTILTTNKNYYMGKYIYKDDGTSTNVRVEIPQKKIGSLEISQSESLQLVNPVNLNIVSNGNINNIVVCLRWSNSIIVVETNYTLISNPNFLQNKVDRCYDLNISLINSALTIPLSFKKLRNLRNDDYIQAFIIDKDYSINNYNNYNNLQMEDNKQDIGMLTQNFTIK